MGFRGSVSRGSGSVMGAGSVYPGSVGSVAGGSVTGGSVSGSVAPEPSSVSADSAASGREPPGFITGSRRRSSVSVSAVASGWTTGVLGLPILSPATRSSAAAVTAAAAMAISFSALGARRFSSRSISAAAGAIISSSSAPSASMISSGLIPKIPPFSDIP